MAANPDTPPVLGAAAATTTAATTPQEGNTMAANNLTPTLPVPTYSTDRFTYMPADNMLVAEASDLGRPAVGSRVYSDACDYGFQVRSARTGRTVLFVLAHEERNSEGELLFEDYRPADTDLWAAGTVRVYND